MKKEIKDTAFAFRRYQIPSFSFKEPDEIENMEDLDIGFSPSGIYNPKSGLFSMSFDCLITFDNNGKVTKVIEVFFNADFQFRGTPSLADIPVYFYRNSIAIVFPYLRAFISSLTLQANIKPIVIPILNLSELEEPLKANTRIEEEEIKQPLALPAPKKKTLKKATK